MMFSQEKHLWLSGLESNCFLFRNIWLFIYSKGSRICLYGLIQNSKTVNCTSSPCFMIGTPLHSLSLALTILSSSGKVKWSELLEARECVGALSIRTEANKSILFVFCPWNKWNAGFRNYASFEMILVGPIKSPSLADHFNTLVGRMVY